MDNNTFNLGIEKNIIENWDKNGKIYYTDEYGNQVQLDTDINPIEKLKRNLEAKAHNIFSFVENENPESEDYKLKTNIVLGLTSAPFGASAKATQWGASKLAPYVGEKIAQSVAQNTGAGLVGGGVEGVARGLIEGENPLMTGVNDAVVGALFGGLGGYGTGRLSKHFDGLNLYGNPQKQEQYFNDYIKGLNDDTPLGKESAFSREFSNFRGLKEGINNGNSNGYYDVDNSLHRQQADLINEYNPAPDTYHTWIRGAEDIQTPHTLFSASNPDLLENPDWTLEDMQKALKTGNVTIYSSYPIDNGFL